MAGTQESNRSITIGRPQAMPGAAEATPGFSTLALRAGYDPADHLNASSVPIYATAAYALHNEEHATAIASFESADEFTPASPAPRRECSKNASLRCTALRVPWRPPQDWRR